MKKTAPVTLDTVREMIFAYPGVSEKLCYGTPAFYVKAKILARLHDDGESLVLKCADRDPLIKADPNTFHVTKHYLNYPIVLVRLAKVRRKVIRELLEQAWRMEASPKLVAVFESGDFVPPPVPIPSAPTPPKSKASRVDQLKRARRICMALPEVEEKEAWGAPTFRVKGRMFAMFVNNHHGDGRIALWLHAPPGVQSMLAQAEPTKFFVPPYMGPSGWIGVHLDRNDDKEVAFHVRQAYCVVAPQKLKDQL
jgi:hypothetical protein